MTKVSTHTTPSTMAAVPAISLALIERCKGASHGFCIIVSPGENLATCPTCCQSQELPRCSDQPLKLRQCETKGAFPNLIHGGRGHGLLGLEKRLYLRLQVGILYAKRPADFLNGAHREHHHHILVLIPGGPNRRIGIHHCEIHFTCIDRLDRVIRRSYQLNAQWMRSVRAVVLLLQPAVV